MLLGYIRTISPTKKLRIQYGEVTLAIWSWHSPKVTILIDELIAHY